MKKLFVITLIIGIAVSVGTLGARAAQVSEGQARNIAAQFMAQKRLGSIDTATPSMLRGVATSHPAIYVFNTAKRGDGWVIVSGDNRALPVLGYSDHGYCNLDSMPENMRAWLDQYAEEIASLGDSDTWSPQAEAGVSPKADVSVSPLLTSQWAQGAPFNFQCPQSGGNYCVTGCVATAMAQIMYYHRWPSSTSRAIPGYTQSDNTNYTMHGTTYQALPTTTFNWNAMKDYYSSSETSTTSAANAAVARLMRYCGQSVEMDYGISSSGAVAQSEVYVDYFRYSPKARQMYRFDYSYSQWEAFILYELRDNRPVVFSGNKHSGGHSFVCDGYDGSGYYHFNWGWRGDQDGYFLLTSLNPKGGGIGSAPGNNGYMMANYIIIGLEPNTVSTSERNSVACTLSTQAASTTYTRSSSSDPFVISIGCEYRNRSVVSRNYDLSWAIYDSSGFSRIANYGNPHNATLAAGESTDVVTRYLQFGAGYANGTYYLRPISRENGGNLWILCHWSGLCYIKAVIKGNILTLTPVNKLISNTASTTTDGVTANISSISSLRKMLRPLDVTLSVRKTCLADNLYFYLWANNELVGANALNLNDTTSGSVTISYIPTQSGTNTLKVTSDQSGNYTYCTGSVTVEPSSASNLSMTYNVIGANYANNYTSLDYSLPFYITIKNNNSAVYHDYIIVNLYNSNDVLIDTKSTICNIAAGGQMSKTFTFENLRLGKYYAKVHYYNYNDQVQALRTIYYTVAEPYDVWVNGIRVNSANEDGITGTGISGTVTYNPITNTLTLNNATLDIRGLSVNAITNAYGGSPNLKIRLVGTNKILAEAYKIAIDVKESQGFTLYGSGTLTCGGALYLDARDHMTNNNTKSYIKDCSVDINQIISEDYEESLIIDNADVTTEYLNVGGDYNGNVGLTLLNCRVVSPSGGYTKDGCIYVGNEEWLGHVEIKRGTASTIPGDVNGDGDVTGSDVTALYNYLLFNDSSAIVNGDQNGDGNITGSDVTAVYNILLGL